MFTSALVVAYLGLCTFLYANQDALIYHPQPRALGATESALVLRVEDAELVVTTRPRPGAPAIVYFGGNAEDVSRNLDAYAAAFPAHALYLLHYRGYGGSSGSPDEAALHRDALALFDMVRAAHAEVAVIGRSLGTGVAVRLASAREVARLVLVTPYDSLEEVAAGRYPYVPVGLLLRDKFDSGALAPKIAVPTTIVAAETDGTIPRASTATLYARFAPGVATWRTIPGTGHGSIVTSAGYFAALREALQYPAPTISP